MKGIKILAGMLALILAVSVTACGRSEVQEDTPSETTAQETESTEATEAMGENELLTLEEIPDEYLASSDQPGQVVRIDYESNTYDEENRSMDKYAYVYLPYGYDAEDEDTRYDIFYLMHGWTGDAELYLGGENGDRPLKRIFDNLIANGDMEPMIVVTPTYYQDNEEKASTVEEEDSILTANFYHELLNDLMPAVESTYHTYAQSVDEEGLQAARKHRIFGGFSMGSVTTWYTFLNALDYFKYYMPISGDSWIISETGMGADEETAEETARYLSEYIQDSGYTQDDFVIYALTGTDDTAYPALNRQIEAMKNYPESFTYSDTASEGNLFFQVAEGGVHNYTSMIQYIYNALPVFNRMMGTGANAADTTADLSRLVTAGTEEYRGFLMDNVLHSENDGDIHYHIYIPDSYDGSEPYALFVTLPGYEGLYFQGMGVNLEAEEFAFEAQKYNENMIIAAPQLDDWGETSANQTVALTRYLLERYNIDTSQVYANGYSGGGETMSLVLEKAPELFTAYLHCSSKWDGDYAPVVENRLPVYLAIGEDDEYYGSEPTREAYEALRDLYLEQGLSEEEIDELLVMDIKDGSYFTERGISNQHGGGTQFAFDEDIMGWLFGQIKS